MAKSLAVLAVAAGLVAFGVAPGMAAGNCGGATAHSQGNMDVAQNDQSGQQTAQTPKPQTTKQ